MCLINLKHEVRYEIKKNVFKRIKEEVLVLNRNSLGYCKRCTMSLAQFRSKGRMPAGAADEKRPSKYKKQVTKRKLLLYSA